MPDLLDTLLTLERNSLERWIQGDPMGFAERASEDITYCEPFLPSRLDGCEAFVAHMASLKGKIRAEGFEVLDPVLQASGDLAMLSFNFRTWNGAIQSRWMATEVYRLVTDRWQLAHSHWSQPVQD